MTDFETIMRPATKALKQQVRKEFIFVYWWHMWMGSLAATVWGTLVAGIWLTHLTPAAKCYLTSLVTFFLGGGSILGLMWCEGENLSESRREVYHKTQ